MIEQNPFVILPYITRRNLVTHPQFQWAKRYINRTKSAVNLFKAFATRMKKFSKEPKFKFGIQVPHNYKDSEKLDALNCNKLQDDVLQSEVKSINDHETFIVLEESEPIPEG